MADPGIEFEPMPDDVGNSVRRYYRIPVDVTDGIQVLFDAVSHSISDISQEGIGVLCQKTDTLLIGETLNDCRLRLGEDEISGLTGRVIHRSSHISGQWHFGIQWLNLDGRDRQILDRVLTALKQQALKPRDIAIQETDFGHG